MPKSKAVKSKKEKAKTKKAKLKKSKSDKKKKEEPKKNKDSINKDVKHIGIICACFSIFQAIIIFALAFTGILCCFFKCGDNKTAASFRYIYQNKSFKSECPMTIIKPIVFFFLCIFYVLLCITWIVVSVLLISALRAWKDIPAVKKAGNIWSIVTLIVIIVDIIVYILFLVDFVLIAQDPKCRQHGLFLSVFVPDDSFKGINTISPNPTISTTEKSEIPNITEENIMNPFFENKMPDQMYRPIKVKMKNLNKSDTSVIPLRRQRHIHPLFKILNAEVPANVAPYLPAMIGMFVAIKLVFAWVANVFLLAYFRIKLARLKDVAKIAENMKSFIQKLNPFNYFGKRKGKGKDKGKAKGKGKGKSKDKKAKSKGKAKSKKGAKKSKKSKKGGSVNPCKCGIRPERPKTAKPKKCQ